MTAIEQLEERLAIYEARMLVLRTCPCTMCGDCIETLCGERDEQLKQRIVRSRCVDCKREIVNLETEDGIESDYCDDEGRCWDCAKARRPRRKHEG